MKIGLAACQFYLWSFPNNFNLMPNTGTSSILLDEKRPYRSLSLLFLTWKLLLLTIVLAAPGIGYDTSTDLLLSSSTHEKSTSNVFALGIRKLIRWDAIYFTEIARKGYVYEQEWAFGWGFTRILAFLARLFLGASKGDEIGAIEIGLAGTGLAIVCHWASTLVLYELTKAAFDGGEGYKDSATKGFAFLSAALHVISPAGVFLCAPYAESPFALLNILAYYAFVKARNLSERGRESHSAVLVLTMGALLGTATTLRGNGIFSGSILVSQACIQSWELLQSLGDRSRTVLLLKRLGATVCSGLLMAILATWPQYVAYKQHCVSPSPQYRAEWCKHRIPSIYAWVQHKYWGVGFLQYWTVSNAPLFLLAAPTLTIMLRSCWWASQWSRAKDPVRDTRQGEVARKRQDPTRLGWSHPWLLFQLALPELLLVTLALTTYHVQIVNRLSSGYVVWIWWLASLLQQHSTSSDRKTKVDIGSGIVKWMVGYAIIQAGLYASFLPPA